MTMFPPKYTYSLVALFLFAFYSSTVMAEEKNSNETEEIGAGGNVTATHTINESNQTSSDQTENVSSISSSNETIALKSASNNTVAQISSNSTSLSSTSNISLSDQALDPSSTKNSNDVSVFLAGNKTDVWTNVTLLNSNPNLAKNSTDEQEEGVITKVKDSVVDFLSSSFGTISHWALAIVGKVKSVVESDSDAPANSTLMETKVESDNSSVVVNNKTNEQTISLLSQPITEGNSSTSSFVEIEKNVSTENMTVTKS